MANHNMDEIADAFSASSAAQARQAEMLSQAYERQAARNSHEYKQAVEAMGRDWQALSGALRATESPYRLIDDWIEYGRDAWERSVLTRDILRRRGDIFLEHEAAGTPPVLVYDYEVIVDGKTLPRPCNYMLLKIVPKGGDTSHDWKRPYVIIDPRAGHGPGIGGFKPDSQVGVALADGHPVYFVAFRPEPEPGQTLADVTHAEAAFLRELHRRHPDAPKPIIVGNCQGGWATALLAATNPDLAGPIVLNGAPMSYWGGRLGQDPMRYTGGMVGGVFPALLMADLGGGLFDGANLVLNFEMLNPGRTWFRKYYDVFADPDGDPARFLEFEKWWGGYFLMTEQEIRWIVENLFVGNRLGKNEARLETGRPIDLKAIRAPVIVFASHGDNITPPQQALNWIIDTYADETEIEIHGQRILYMVHEEVGHLGIFVSSSVARKEHTQMASTLKTIEALAPGLYEMVISDVTGSGREKSFTVDFQRRTLDDLRKLDDERVEEPAFAAVARMSEAVAETYDTTVRPVVKAMVPPLVAEASRKLHPMRAQRWGLASNSPLSANVAETAATVREQRHKADDGNPFVKAERLFADMVELSWNMVRDMRAMSTELAFLSIYGSPFAQWYGRTHAKSRVLKRPDELRALPAVQTALGRIEQGGVAEAIIRMLILLASTRGDVRRDRLERSSEVLTTREPFCSMDAAAKSRMIHEQTMIMRFEPDAGLAALPKLLDHADDRALAFAEVDYIVGDPMEMEPHTVQMMNRMRTLCGLQPMQFAATEAAQ